MKRFAVFFIFALGIVSSVRAEVNHTPGSSQIKRATSDAVGTGFAGRANSIVGACDTVRPGTPVGDGGGTGDLFQAQLPSGGTGSDLLGGSAGGAAAGGAAAAGKALVASKCTTCHGVKPPKRSIEVLNGQNVPAGMSSFLSKLSASDKSALIAYLSTL